MSFFVIVEVHSFMNVFCNCRRAFIHECVIVDVCSFMNVSAIVEVHSIMSVSAIVEVR